MRVTSLLGFSWVCSGFYVNNQFFGDWADKLRGIKVRSELGLRSPTLRTVLAWEFPWDLAPQHLSLWNENHKLFSDCDVLLCLGQKHCVLISLIWAFWCQGRVLGGVRGWERWHLQVTDARLCQPSSVQALCAYPQRESTQTKSIEKKQHPARKEVNGTDFESQTWGGLKECICNKKSQRNANLIRCDCRGCRALLPSEAQLLPHKSFIYNPQGKETCDSGKAERGNWQAGPFTVHITSRLSDALLICLPQVVQWASVTCIIRVLHGKWLEDHFWEEEEEKEETRKTWTTGSDPKAGEGIPKLGTARPQQGCPNVCLLIA